MGASDTLCFEGKVQPNTLRMMDSPVEDGGTLTLTPDAQARLTTDALPGWRRSPSLAVSLAASLTAPPPCTASPPHRPHRPAASLQTLEDVCASLLASLRKHAPGWEELMDQCFGAGPANPALSQAKVAGKEAWFYNVLASAIENYLYKHGLPVAGELTCSFTGPLPPYSEV